MPGQNPPNAAASLIGQILTRPNPQGFRIAQQASQAGSSGAGGGGGGIAGVASKAEMEGIMVYNERTAYNEWEFVFDQTKMRAPAQLTPQGTGQQPGRGQQQQSPMFQIGGTGATPRGGPTGGPTSGGNRGATGGMSAPLPSTYRPGRP
jgi:hypothetical protein